MRFIIFSLAFFSLAACAQQGGGVQDLNPDEAEAKMAQNEVVVLDVRTADEYDKDHLENAQQIDYYEPDFKENLQELDKDKTYVVYCHSGGRSSKSADLMQEMGFKNVFNLEGGITSWKEADKKVVK